MTDVIFTFENSDLIPEDYLIEKNRLITKRNGSFYPRSTSVIKCLPNIRTHKLLDFNFRALIIPDDCEIMVCMTKNGITQYLSENRFINSKEPIWFTYSEFTEEKLKFCESEKPEDWSLHFYFITNGKFSPSIEGANFYGMNILRTADQKISMVKT